jgi:hypothetical protein
LRRYKCHEKYVETVATNDSQVAPACVVVVVVVVVSAVSGLTVLKVYDSQISPVVLHSVPRAFRVFGVDSEKFASCICLPFVAYNPLNA